MLFSLVLAVATHVVGSDPLPAEIALVHACRDAIQNQGLNLPPQTMDRSTEVAHASIVLVGESITGVLYRTHGGGVWYQDGPINRRNTTPLVSTRAVLKMLDLHPTRKGIGSFNSVSPKALAALIGGSVSLWSCY